eukprot:6632327-Alexandrium_andersonii.AAC.1
MSAASGREDDAPTAAAVCVAAPGAAAPPDAPPADAGCVAGAVAAKTGKCEGGADGSPESAIAGVRGT